MKRIGGMLLVAMSILMFAGCSSQPQVETDHQADFDFSSLKTFEVAETKQNTQESILVSPFTLSHIHSALNGELTKRYQSVATGAKPDFIVSYHVVIEEKIDPNSYDALYGYGYGYGYYGRGYYRPWPYYGYGTGVRVYNQGSLIIDIADAKTGKPIWRGVSEKRLGRSMAPQQQREVLSAAVAEVMAHFPPVN
jgi:hypothetical protein